MSSGFPYVPSWKSAGGVPREPVRLVGAATDPLMIAERSGKDWRMRMNQYVRKRIKLLAQLDLSGAMSSISYLQNQAHLPGAQS